MEAIRNKNQEELRKAREELFRELDKGIRDMEQRIKLRLNGKSPVQARALFLAHNLVS